MRTVSVHLDGVHGVPEVRDGNWGPVLARGTSLMEDDSESANARFIRTVIGRPQAEVVIRGKVYPPPLSRSAAKRQAHSESHMYRQGSGWVVVTYDPAVDRSRTSEEGPWPVARQSLADWRRRRAAYLEGEPVE